MTDPAGAVRALVDVLVAWPGRSVGEAAHYEWAGARERALRAVADAGGPEALADALRAEGAAELRAGSGGRRFKGGAGAPPGDGPGPAAGAASVVGSLREAAERNRARGEARRRAEGHAAGCGGAEGCLLACACPCHRPGRERGLAAAAAWWDGPGAQLADRRARAVESLADRLLTFAAGEDRAALDCDHCGGAAIWGDANGEFADGDGGRCASCGFPGQVSCDAETAAYWNANDADPDARCDDPACADCAAPAADAAPPPAPLREAVWTPKAQDEVHFCGTCGESNMYCACSGNPLNTKAALAGAGPDPVREALERAYLDLDSLHDAEAVGKHTASKIAAIRSAIRAALAGVAREPSHSYVPSGTDGVHELTEWPPCRVCGAAKADHGAARAPEGQEAE